MRQRQGLPTPGRLTSDKGYIYWLIPDPHLRSAGISGRDRRSVGYEAGAVLVIETGFTSAAGGCASAFMAALMYATQAVVVAVPAGGKATTSREARGGPLTSGDSGF